MSKIELFHDSCINIKADAVVNAANRMLINGGGICGQIFKAASIKPLLRACQDCNPPLNDGDAVITDGFNIPNQKYIIHAVGPNFSKTPNAFHELYLAYYNSLLVATNNNIHTISFPLISAGIFGGDLKDAPGESAKQCIKAYNDFINEYPDYDIELYLCGYNTGEYLSAKQVFEDNNILN